MESFLQLVNLRQSVRRYTDQAVEPGKIELCLEAARLAPSASNSQPWRFIVVTEEPLLKEVARATFNDIYLINRFTLQAPVIIVIVVEKTGLINRLAMQIKNKDWPLIDIGIAAEHMCLQAAGLGLGSCMIGWYDESKIKELLLIPSDKTVGLMVTMGYPPEDYPLRAKTRKSSGMVVSYQYYPH